MDAAASPATLLVTVTELAEELRGTPRPRLLDVRWRLGEPGWGHTEFLRGHLPGARFVDLESALSGPPGSGGRHPLPRPGVFEAAMRRAGVDAADRVVVHDAADSLAAARAWWVLRYFGHAEVRILDGGFAAWREAGLPVEAGRGDPAAAGDLRALPGGMPLLDAAGAARLAAEGVLLDARAPERFRGEVEPVDPVAGHIPGARNAPTTANLDERGRFRPAAALRERFAALGARPGAAVGAYCGSGVTAAHEVAALALAGVPAALYVGSWSEWITDPGRPVARGEG